jgi:hypothetical protein
MGTQAVRSVDLESIKECRRVALPGLDWIRRRQRALGKGVLALFCLVWLQAALLPCAMGMSAPAMTDMAAMSMDGEEHCVYCPPAGQPADDAAPPAPSGCQYPDGPHVDTRFTLASTAVAPLAIVTFVLASDADAIAAPPPERVADCVTTRPPLAVSYCRYLK